MTLVADVLRGEFMTVNCKPTSSELKKSIGKIFNLRRRNKIISFSIVFLMMSVLVFSTNSLVNLVLGFICVGFAVLMPLVHIISALVAIRDAGKHKFTLTVGDRGITFKTKHEFFTDFDSIEAFEHDELITLLADSSQIYCVPKRSFDDQEKLAEFEAILTKKLANRYIKTKKQAGV